MEMVDGVLRLALLLMWTCTVVSPGFTPSYLTGSQSSYNARDGSRRHPDGYQGANSYFRSTAVSSSVPGGLLVGGADRVVILNTTTLDMIQRLTFGATSSALTNCSAESAGYVVDSLCRNHLAVFPNPADPSKLVVCGSDAAKTPSCRAVNASGFGAGTSVTATGIVPSSPDYFGYGSFFTLTLPTSANFFAAVNTYSSAYLAYYNINYTDPSDLSSLSVTMKFRTPTARNWFADPTTIVDVVKYEYPPRPTTAPLAGTITPDEHKYFFVFMRERNDYLLTQDSEIISRVGRICQNDPGSPVPDTGTGYSYPQTFMKAQIYCRRNSLVPDYSSTYTYHYLQSVALNQQQGGRYSQSQTDPPIRLLYGSFTSSPDVGGKISAICVYSAQDSKNYIEDSGGTSNSLIDAFQLYLINSITNQRYYNVLAQCDPSGRWSIGPEYSDYVTVAPPTLVAQYTSDPLLVLNGVSVVKMAVDQVCVAFLGTSVCLMQDVLFLGTDEGKLMKVVVTSSGTPVIIEELTFDDNNPINQLDVQSDSNSIMVTTATKVYHLPLERCSYKYGSNCRACIQSQDPYCVWNYETQQCERNYLMEGPNSNISTSFDSTRIARYYQNVHTGVVQNLSCAATPSSCSLTNVSDPTNKVPEIQVQLAGVGCSSISIMIKGPLNISGIISSSSVVMSVPPSGLLLLSTQLVGFQTYDITAFSPEGVVGAATLTTNPQAPLPSSVGAHVVSLNSTALRVTVQVVVLTDDIQNYWFQVRYMGITLTPKCLTASGQSFVIVNPSLMTTRSVSVSVNISNSQGYLLLDNTVSLAPPPATCSSTLTALTATSVTLLLTSTYSTRQGYTVLVNSIKRSDCTVPTSNSVTVEGLAPFTTYNISVQACSDVGEGPSCGVLITTLCAVPGRIRGLVVSMNTSQMLQFTWQRPSKPNGPLNMYKITRRCYPSFARQPSLITTQNTSTLTLPNLQPSTSCCVTVAAINMCNGTTYEGLGTTLCSQTPDTPPEVQNLSAVVLSLHSISLTWSKLRLGLKYTVTSSLGTTNVSDVSSVIVEGLSQGVPYSFTVQAFSGALAGPRSTVNVTIPSTPSVPVPGTLTMVTNSTAQVSFSWSGGGALVQQYRVYLQCNQLMKVFNVTPPTTMLIVDVSDPGADFGSCAITVQAVNALGPSGNSSVTRATVTAVPNRPPSRPTSYMRRSRSSGTTFSWDVQYPFSLANLTVLSSLMPSYGVSEQSYVFNGSSIVMYVTTADVKYSNFTTRLCGTWGCGLPSNNLVNFVTNSILLPPPTDCKIMALTSSSVTVNWNTPLGVANTNLSYRILLSGPAPKVPVDEVIQAASTDPQQWTNSELCAETRYVLSIGTNGPTAGQGPVVPCAAFLTPSAPLSSPTNLSAVWRYSGNVNVFWKAPPITNGSVKVYEILWDHTPHITCGNSSATWIKNTTSQEYTFATSNASVTLLVCVRAYNNQQKSEWAWLQVTPLQTTSQSAKINQRTPLGRDPGLLAAVVLAFVFMLSTALLTLVVACMCCHISDQPPEKSEVAG